VIPDEPPRQHATATNNSAHIPSAGHASEAMNLVEDDLAQPLVVGPWRAEVGVRKYVCEQHAAALRHGAAGGEMPVGVALGF